MTEELMWKHFFFFWLNPAHCLTQNCLLSFLKKLTDVSPALYPAVTFFLCLDWVLLGRQFVVPICYSQGGSED